MNNKQSSIDWLISGLLEYIHEGHHLEVLELYEQAKAMHKKEIINSYEIGFADAWDDARYDDEPKYKSAEQYYNETFGSAE